MSILSPSLVARILDGYALPPRGVHGVAHWARVLENGRRLAVLTEGSDLDVIELFAIFHDSRRVNEAVDHGHGRRGADLAAQLRGEYFQIDDARFALLQLACQDHTRGMTRADPTVQVCWDSDRLDLLRVGTWPAPTRLCTPAARTAEMLDWANRRASSYFAPDLIGDEWALRL